MRKPILIKLDTVTNLSEALYSNIVYSDTLQIKFSLFENSVGLNLSGQTITLIIKKPNGHGIEKNITGITGNTFTINLDEQATCIYGDVEGELILTDSNGTSISNRFSYYVKKGLQDGLINSTDDVQTLVSLRQLIADAQNTLDKYKDTIFEIAGTTDALQALINIREYIDTHLEELTKQNADAVINISKLESSINNADESSKNALEAAELCDNKKANLNQKINLATTKITDIENSINNANEAKENLLEVKNATEQLVEEIKPISDKVAQIDKNTEDLTNHINDNTRHFENGEKVLLKKQINELFDLLNFLINQKDYCLITEDVNYLITEDEKILLM